MKKVAVIGRGTAGAQAAMHFAGHAGEYEVEWYFDDSIKPQSVGEGSTLQLPKNLALTQGFTWSQLERLGGTVKTGIYKENWGSETESFYHDFYPDEVAMHFQAHLLHQYALEELEGKIGIHKQFVGSPDDIDADYVMDCTGTPKELGDEFHISESIPVTTAKVWQCPWDFPRFNHTLAIAGKYGWIFGVPLLNRCSIGYIYNRDFATPEQIEEDVQRVFEKYGLTPGTEENYLEFNSYWRKQNFDGRVGYNGNSSFFLEPLEATSTATMDLCQRGLYDIVVDSNLLKSSNDQYSLLMKQTETMIMMHYLPKTKFKTEFWEYANDKAKSHFSKAKQDNLLTDHIAYVMSNIELDTIPQGDLSAWSTWSATSIGLHVKKLGLQEEMLNVLYSK